MKWLGRSATKTERRAKPANARRHRPHAKIGINNLVRALDGLIGLFERIDVPYTLMGGVPVRIYGIPHPTYHINFMRHWA